MLCLLLLLVPALAQGEPRGWADDGYTGETARQRAARHEARCVRRMGDGMTLSSDRACFEVLREHVLDAVAALDAETAVAKSAQGRTTGRRVGPLKSIPTAPWYFGQSQ